MHLTLSSTTPVDFEAMLRRHELGPLTSEQTESLQRMDTSARALLDLINATLDLNRLEAQEVALELKEITVADFVREL